MVRPLPCSNVKTAFLENTTKMYSVHTLCAYTALSALASIYRNYNSIDLRSFIIDGSTLYLHWLHNVANVDIAFIHQ